MSKEERDEQTVAEEDQMYYQVSLFILDQQMLVIIGH